jgi:hypothetical protein
MSKKPIPPKGLAFKVLEKLIDSRREGVRNNPDLKITNRWDLSDCFYNTRKKLDSMGYDVSIYGDREKRKDITNHVKVYCDRLGIKRHDIGIFAADRAVMAFQGQLYSVSFENYKQLAYLGVDVLCVEKEGIVDKLVPFTTEFGIALVQSEGFLSEYGQMLAQEADKTVANVIMLTDFDSSGIELAYKIKGITRLGINLGSVDEVNKQSDETGKKFEQLDPLNLLEGYDGANHWKHLNYLSKGLSKHRGTRKVLRIEKTQHDEDYINLLNQKYKFRDGTKQSYIDFIRDKRIELNTIVNEIGAQRFWNWLKDKLLETFPTRDYNRAIDVPEYVLTPTMEKFQDKLKRSIAVILQAKGW